MEVCQENIGVRIMIVSYGGRKEYERCCQMWEVGIMNLASVCV